MKKGYLLLAWLLLILPGAALAQSPPAEWVYAARNAQGLARARALNQLAAYYLSTAEPDRAIGEAERARAFCGSLRRQPQDSAGAEHDLPGILQAEAEANYHLGDGWLARNDLRKALKYYREARLMASRAGDQALAQRAADQIARCEALRPESESLIGGIVRKAGELVSISDTEENAIKDQACRFTLTNLEATARKAEANNNYRQAAMQYELMLPCYRELQDTLRLTATYRKLGMLYDALRLPETARRYYALAGDGHAAMTAPDASRPVDEVYQDLQASGAPRTAPSAEETAILQQSTDLLRLAEEQARRGNYKASSESYRQYATMAARLDEMRRLRQQDSLAAATLLEGMTLLQQQQEIKTRRIQLLALSLGSIVVVAALLTYFFILIRASHRKLKGTYDELAQTHQQLQATQTQLVSSEKMASLGQLTAGIAHEINNPVNFISGNIFPLRSNLDDLLALLNAYEFALRNAGRADEADRLQRQYQADLIRQETYTLLQGMDEGARRTAEIVRGLRTFARMDEDDPKKFDLEGGIEATLALLVNRLEGIEVIRNYSSLPEVEGYPGKINQVLMNVLTNAIQAMPKGGLLYIATAQKGPHAELTIRDTGTGMSEAVRRRIFEPFFTTKDVGEGTGLGLPISLGIIHQHKGRIEVSSMEGQGTEVRISLPLVFEGAPAGAQPSTSRI
ncbi:MAG: ATP-binding protein [Bacteroidia bacterium]|nr:ATP-binding protein [Bacteroidia bacterium]